MITIPTTRIVTALALLVLFAVFLGTRWQFPRHEQDPAESKNMVVASVGTRSITLREIEGLSYEEIATIMNCPIGTVRSRIFRARDTISLKLKPLLDTPDNKRW